MSINSMKWAWEQRTGCKTAKSVLVALSDWASDHGHPQEYCWHCQETIAERVECDTKTVRRALAYLEGNGFIRRQKRSRPDGTGRSSDLIYLCTERPVDQTLKTKAEIGVTANGQNDQEGANGQNVRQLPVKMTVNPRSKCPTNLKEGTSKREPYTLEASHSNADGYLLDVSFKSGGCERKPTSGQPKAKPKAKRKGAAAYTEAFDRCWAEFPARQRMSKTAAFKSWQREDCEDIASQVMSGIAGYRAQLKKDGTPDDKVKHMQGWLTDRRWEGYAPAPEQQAQMDEDRIVTALALDLDDGHRDELVRASKWYRRLADVPAQLRRLAEDMLATFPSHGTFSSQGAYAT